MWLWYMSCTTHELASLAIKVIITARTLEKFQCESQDITQISNSSQYLF
jgi:hypothetical protein